MARIRKIVTATEREQERKKKQEASQRAAAFENRKLGIPGELDDLNFENALLWYEHMRNTQQIQSQEKEAADLWYTLMIGGKL